MSYNQDLMQSDRIKGSFALKSFLPNDHFLLHMMMNTVEIIFLLTVCFTQPVKCVPLSFLLKFDQLFLCTVPVLKKKQ